MTFASLASFAFNLEGFLPRPLVPLLGLLPKALHQGVTEAASSK